MIQNSSKIVPERIGNTKTASQSAPRKIWVFTLNNYTDEEFSSIVQHFSHDKFVIGKEISENGTPHLQGHIELTKKQRITALMKLNPKIHWEPCRNKLASREYCTKENNFVTNIRMKRPIKFPEMNKPWQLDILKLIETEPDDRTIYWYYDTVGGIGKTIFTKYLIFKHHAIIVPTRGSDAFHTLAKIDEEDEAIDIVIFDIPRDSFNYINYGAMEKIKNGCIASGKYECRSFIFAPPHVIVFSNDIPEMDKFSPDRWKIIDITPHDE